MAGEQQRSVEGSWEHTEVIISISLPLAGVSANQTGHIPCSTSVTSFHFCSQTNMCLYVFETLTFNGITRMAIITIIR